MKSDDRCERYSAVSGTASGEAGYIKEKWGMEHDAV
jgi:hypothetical protein